MKRNTEQSKFRLRYLEYRQAIFTQYHEHETFHEVPTLKY